MSKYKCVKCRKTFNSETILKTHTCNTPQHKKLVQCNLCPKSFTLQSRLKNHMRSHSDERIFKCSKCNESFKYPTGLKYHEEKHNDIEFKCALCDKSFPSVRLLKHHNQKVRCGPDSDEKPFKCFKCNKCFKTSQGLGMHENRHNGVEYKCDQCEKSFPAVQLLKQHKRVTLCYHNSDEKLFKCLKCNKDFKSSVRLKFHEKRHQIKYECAQCGKFFFTVRGLKNHKQNVCRRSTLKLVCNICFKSFQKKFNLIKHLRLHTGNGHQYGESGFRCKLCYKIYSSKSLLNQHNRVVHKVGKLLRCENCNKPFHYNHNLLLHKSKYCRKPKLMKCYECLELFGNESLLNVHVKNHSAFRKQFPCFNCGKSFDDKKALKSHAYVHTNKRPFECDECKLTFKTKSNLRKHKYNIHTGIRMHHCFQCNESFSAAATLRSHLQSLKHKQKVEELQIQGGEVKDEFVNADQVTSSNYQMQSEKSDNSNIFLTSDVHFNANSSNEHPIEEEACSIIGEKSFYADKNSFKQSFPNKDEKRFECDECTKKFKSKQVLNKHKDSVHLGIRSHHCFQCNTSFTFKDKLEQHFKTIKHKSNKLQSEGKNACVNIEQLPSTNTLSHSLLKPSENSDNSNIFWTSDVQLNGHSSNQHPVKEEACSIEGEKSYDTDSELMRQSFRNKDGKRFECEECFKKFPFRSNLTKHKESVHLKIRPHHCLHCNTSFTGKDKLERHFKTLKHKTKVKEIQGEGGDVFINNEQPSSSDSLSLSIQKPSEKSDNNAYHCVLCNISFTFKVKLIRHFSTHKHKRNELQKAEGGPIKDEFVNAEPRPYPLAEQSSINFNRYIPITEDNSDNDTILLTSKIQIKDELINQNNSDNSNILLTSEIEIKDELINQNNSDNSTVLLTSETQIKDETNQYNYDNSNILITSEIEIKDESIQHFAEGEQNFIGENSSGSITQ